MNNLFTKHLNKFVSETEKNGIECSIITNSSNIFYLTGFNGPATLIVCKEASILYVPVLEYARARKNVPKSIEVAAYSKYPLKNINIEKYVQKDLMEIIKEKLSEKDKIGIEKETLVLRTYSKLKETLGERTYHDISNIITRLRSIKDSYEIELIKQAILISEKSYLETIESLNNDLSELEVAGILEANMRRRGAENYAFPTIVAFGENAAYPHAQPGSRRLGENNVVLIDWGAKSRGYCSDMTRTLIYGARALEKIMKDIEVVKDAQEEAIDRIAPGVNASEVDSIARDILEKNGLSKYFIHGLGHGVGVDVHEPPYLTPGSKDILEPGMIVTVEPGIYIEGKYGIRIEDMVLVTKKGRQVLTNIRKMIKL